jgi:hypothetical protein
MASPLAVLSEAAHVYEQMEQLKMAEQLATTTQLVEHAHHHHHHQPAALAPATVAAAAAAAGSGGPAGPGPMPWVLVVPQLNHAAATNHAYHAAHAQALALQAMQTNAYMAALSHLTPPEPPRNLVLQPAGSLGSSGPRSLDSNESSEGYPPWHTEHANQPIKTPTIVRNPAHQANLVQQQSLKMKSQKVVLRQKKRQNTVDSHFRRSLGTHSLTTFDGQQQTPVHVKKRPSSMIEHSEVDDHFIRVFGADEWKKLTKRAKR